MSFIHISNLTFAYEGSYDTVFENVDIRIDTDWKLGFIGRNGKGKTTFLNLLLGKYEYRGSIVAQTKFEYFPYELPDSVGTTQEAIQSLGGEYEQWELVRELALLGVGEEVLTRPVQTLSGGEQAKVSLAVLFLKGNTFLLIDEPTNHLDREGRQKLGAYLRSKRGYILVSHDRLFLDSCIDHVLSMNRAHIELQKGNFSSWWENKERQDQFELAENEKKKAEIKRLTVAAKRSSDWSDKVEKSKYGTKNSGLRPDRGFLGHKAAKMMQRSKNLEQRQQSALDEKEKLLKNLEKADPLKLHPMTYHSTLLARLDGVTLCYGEHPVCQEVRFSIEQGDRIALSGRNGSGKSSLLKLILGEKIDYTGQFYKGSQLVISYVSQDTSFLQGSFAAFITQYQLDESLFKAILRKLDFSRVQFEKDLSALSGGQRKKVLIAKSLCEKAHLYLWDEPLNFIDVLSRMQIEQLLLEYRPTILFVEHDAFFCDAVATKTIPL